MEKSNTDASDRMQKLQEKIESMKPELEQSITDAVGASRTVMQKAIDDALSAALAAPKLSPEKQASCQKQQQCPPPEISTAGDDEIGLALSAPGGAVRFQSAGCPEPRDLCTLARQVDAVMAKFQN